MPLSQPLARQIVEVLGSSGTPPVKGVQYFNVGNHSLLHALDEFYLSSYLQDGGAAYKMVIGDYGSGKSHFLYCLRDLAWERGFAVSKVDLWYRELFNDMASKYDSAEITQYWENMLHYRFIMTFRVEGFSVPKLEERLADLMQQNIFKPYVIILDGLKFDESGRGLLVELKELAKKYSMRIWFTIHTHRHEPPTDDGLPLSFRHVEDLFDVLVQLVAEGPEVYIKVLKGRSSEAKQDALLLDPATMLIKV